MTRTGGFTLIEMLIALAILAGSFTTLLAIQGNTVQSLEKADQLQIAAMLARGKMLDVEEDLRQHGFQTGIVTDDGDFDDEGFEGFEWIVEIEPVEISDESEDQFVANIHAELFGEGATGAGSLTGSAAVSQYLPMIIGQVPRFINSVGERTRKITLTVAWECLGNPMELRVTQYFVLLARDREALEVAVPTAFPNLGMGNMGEIEN